RIVVRGTHGEHWLNGVKVVEYDRKTPAFRAIVAGSKYHVYPGFGEADRGYILLQDHGFPVGFRNIKLHELP
ncbi:MAG TPA: family 16 glycoside hydrolase, partial [Terriglobus sp.]